jgi:hypothetical protein
MSSSGCRLSALLIVMNFFLPKAYSQWAQFNYHEQFKLPNGLPPSPNVASIEKFGNVPVSYSTGVPKISIPIWNISCGQSLRWPVSLSYHAGGIRVDETASSAGLGWSLIAPGVISRAVVGKPDEAGTNEPIYTSVTDNDDTYLYGVIDGYNDSEMDLFSFNFNGRSGKFVIKQDGSIMQIPYSTLRITKSSISLGSFTIVDENGVSYLFDKLEDVVSTSNPGTSIQYNTSWYLSKVETPDKKKFIEFIFSSAGSSFQTYYSNTQNLAERYNISDFGGCEIATLADDFSSSIGTNIVQNNALKLDRINFPNGYILINYSNNRTDISGTNLNRINNIEVYAQKTTPADLDKLINRISLQQSYFFYRPPNISTDNPRQYRLRLDGIQEYAQTSTPKVYTFEYNTTPMMPRESFGQDIWGYNNGKYTNQSMMQTQTAYYKGSPHTFGNADRTVDLDQMKACVLTTINWPTGGKTTFAFEPHQYNAGTTTTPNTQQSSAVGDIMPTYTHSFTFSGALAGPVRVKVFMSPYNYPGVTQPQTVFIKDVTTNTEVYRRNQTTPNQIYQIDEPFSLVSGHTYELTASVFTNVSNGQLSASITLQWDTYTGQAQINSGGGLRVKEIKNYSDNNVLQTAMSYEYDPGQTLTFYDIVKQNFKEAVFRAGTTGGISCQAVMCMYHTGAATSLVYQSGSVFPLSTFSGSFVIYGKVTEHQLDRFGGKNNGKTEYLYDVFPDEVLPVPAGNIFNIMLFSNEWKNGNLSQQLTYKGTSGTGFQLVKKVENRYIEIKPAETRSLKVIAKYLHIGCWIRGPGYVQMDMFYFTYPIKTGCKKLVEIKETTFTDNTGQIVVTTNMEYGSVDHDMVTRTSVMDSKNDERSITSKYPVDFSAPGNVYEKMVQQNIVAPIVEQKTFKGAVNPVLLSTIKTNFRDWLNDGKIIQPETVQGALLNNTPETKVQYFKFDDNANYLAVSKANDVVIHVVWDYGLNYPVAQCTSPTSFNTANQDVAYTSFESNGTGNFVISGGTIDPSIAYTGRKAYLFSGGSSITKNNLNSALSYTVSYWSKNGPMTVGFASTQLETKDGWTRYEHRNISGVSSLVITGTGAIDELRLQPQGSQMSTVCYEPLFGVTVECDMNSSRTFYNYDALGRLIMIRDDNKNIRKKFCYNYSGQTENCNLYGNVQKSQLFTRNNCGSGYLGQQVVYTVPANTYYASSAAEADQMAQDDVNNNGQAFANATGTCIASAPITYWNYTSGTITVVLFNASTGAVYSVYGLNAFTYNTVMAVVPQGTYHIQLSSSQLRRYNVAGYQQNGVYDATFYYINIGSGGISITVQNYPW